MSSSARPAAPSLPALGPLLVMADEARRRGELEQALAGYKAALMVSEPSDHHGRGEVYARIGEVKLAQGRLREAEHNFEKALAVDPNQPVATDSLVGFRVAAGAFEEAIALLERMAQSAALPDIRVSAFVRMADLLATSMGDSRRAAAALELAAAVPSAPLSVLTRLRDLYESESAWAPLERTFTRLVERYAQAGDVESAWSSCRRLAKLRSEVTKEIPGAIEAWQGAIRCRPDDMDARERLALLLLEVGDTSAAYQELAQVVKAVPLRPDVHALLGSLHTKANRIDRAWLSAVALEATGSLDLDAELVVGQHRKDSPVRPETSVDSAAWSELLSFGVVEPLVTAVIVAVGPAAIRARLHELEAHKKLMALDPARRQSATSTVSAVRSFVWASQVLSVPTPELYVLDDVPGGTAAVAAGVPTTALGPVVLRGLSAKRLAFASGRHLTYYRPEFYPLVFFPTVTDLRDLFLAAVALGLPELATSTPSDALRLSAEIGKALNPEERERLGEAVRAFSESGGQADMASWVRGVELCAARAGLLLAGDLATALSHIGSEERHVGDLTLEERRRDLVAYSVGDRYALLREKLGIAAK